jgi:hypothetical protein
LGQGRFVTLAVCDLLGVERDCSVGLEDGVDGLAVHDGRQTRGDVVQVVGRARGRFDVGGEAHPEPAPNGQGFGLRPLPVIEPGQLHGRVEHPTGRHPLVEGQAGDHGRREFVGADQVAPPDLGPGEAELPGDDVEHPLADEGLDLPRPPVRDVGRLVGEQDPAVELQGRDPVGAGEHGAGDQGNQDGAVGEGRIGTAVDRQAGPHSEDRAVVADGHRHFDAVFPGLAPGGEVLAAVLDPFHRPAEFEGRGAHGDVFPVDHRLGSEGTSDIAGHDVRQCGRVAPDQARNGGVHRLRSLQVGDCLPEQFRA